MEYCNKYPNIIRAIFQEENQYQKGVKIMEVILSSTKAEFIAICEGDDIWLDKNKLQKQVDFLRTNPGYVITYHDSIPFDEKGSLDFDFGGAKKDMTSLQLQQAHPINTLTVCFRNVIKEFPPEYRATSFGDLFLWSLLGKYGKGKYINDIIPAHYRVHDRGVFSAKKMKIKREMALVNDSTLYAYYRRTGNKDLASHFKNKTLLSAILSYSFLGIIFTLTKILIKKLSMKLTGNK
jgi:hypothetical protein